MGAWAWYPLALLHNQASSSDRLCICTNTNSPSACSTTEQTPAMGGNGKLLSKKGNESLVLKDSSTLRNGMWTSVKLSRRCLGSKKRRVSTRQLHGARFPLTVRRVAHTAIPGKKFPAESWKKPMLKVHTFYNPPLLRETSPACLLKPKTS